MTICDLYKFVNSCEDEYDLLKLGYLEELLKQDKRNLKSYAQKINADVTMFLQAKRSLFDPFPKLGEEYYLFMRGIVRFTDECCQLISTMSKVERQVMLDYIELQACKHGKVLERESL